MINLLEQKIQVRFILLFFVGIIVSMNIYGVMRDGPFFCFLLSSMILWLMTLKETPLRLIIASIFISGIGYLGVLSFINDILSGESILAITTSITFLTFCMISWFVFFTLNLFKARRIMIDFIFIMGMLTILNDISDLNSRVFYPSTWRVGFSFLFLACCLRLIMLNKTHIVFQGYE